MKTSYLPGVLPSFIIASSRLLLEALGKIELPLGKLFNSIVSPCRPWHAKGASSAQSA